MYVKIGNILIVKKYFIRCDIKMLVEYFFLLHSVRSRIRLRNQSAIRRVTNAYSTSGNILPVSIIKVGSDARKRRSKNAKATIISYHRENIYSPTTESIQRNQNGVNNTAINIIISKSIRIYYSVTTDTTS